MARKVKSTCEIALSKEDFAHAVYLWLYELSLGADFRLSKVTMHPDAKYVVRATVEPPQARETIAKEIEKKNAA